MGAKVAEFERDFAAYHGTRYAVMVNSGSSANLLMVAALVYSGRLPRGSRVVVPAVSWATTYAPLEQYGMRVVVVDVDDTLCIDPTKIPDDVDAIFGVNLLGNPCEWWSFSRRALWLEDNCEALGATYNGRKTGTFGVMASHSLFFSHHITTMEGGVITTDDEELWRLLLMLRAHGWTRDLPAYEPGFESFSFEVPGYNLRPTEIQGAIGVEQLRKLDHFLALRRKNAAVYRDEIGHQREVGESSWFGFALLVANRAALLERLPHVETRPIVAGNILRHPMARFLDLEAGPTPMADYVHECGLFVGNHTWDLTEDLRHVAAALVASEAA
jgi:CDP-6-deoxy-D-xylo-4-hexulose-3-dehydrase